MDIEYYKMVFSTKHESFMTKNYFIEPLLMVCHSDKCHYYGEHAFVVVNKSQELLYILKYFIEF